MKEDIYYEIGNESFNYRVAVIIRRNNDILLQVNTLVPFLVFIGGRVSLGETSVQAAIREFKEETGIDTIHKKSIALIENFFKSSYNGQNYHEILIVHELEFQDKSLYQEEVFSTIEKKHQNHITFHWFDIEDLKDKDIRPKIVLDLLAKQEFQYIINKD